MKVRLDGELVETTVGRVLLKEILPEEIPFRLINKVMKKSELANLIDYCYRYGGDKKTVLLSDRLKGLGYYYATSCSTALLPVLELSCEAAGLSTLQRARCAYSLPSPTKPGFSRIALKTPASEFDSAISNDALRAVFGT